MPSRSNQRLAGGGWRSPPHTSYTSPFSRARSSVGERSLHTREVAGSKPAAPIVEGPANAGFGVLYLRSARAPFSPVVSFVVSNPWRSYSSRPGAPYERCAALLPPQAVCRDRPAAVLLLLSCGSDVDAAAYRGSGSGASATPCGCCHPTLRVHSGAGRKSQPILPAVAPNS
jgi:hypothetical protein